MWTQRLIWSIYLNSLKKIITIDQYLPNPRIQKENKASMAVSNAALAISLIGSMVAAASTKEARIKCYDAHTSHLKYTLFPSVPTKQPISKLLFCKDDTYLVGRLSDNSTILVWDLVRGVEAHRIIIANDMELRDVTVRKAFITVLVQSSSHSKFHILEYDVSSGKLARKIKAGSSSEQKEGAIQCSPCGKFYAVLIEKQMKLLDTETGKRTYKISVDALVRSLQMTTQMMFTLDAANILYCSDSKKLAMYSTETADEDAMVIETATKENEIVSFSVDENVVILTFANGQAKLILLDEHYRKIKSTHTVSLENGTIFQAGFHPSSPHTQLQIVVQNEDLSFEALVYRSEDNQTITLDENHIISKRSDGAQPGENERPSKKAKLTENEEQTGDYEYNEHELTIAERLQALSKQTELASTDDDEQKNPEDEDDDDEALSSPRISTTAATTTTIANTQSVSAILSQILQSNDDTTLEHNIFREKSVCSHATIVKSLSSLSSHQLNVLMCKIIHRVALQPSRILNGVLNSWLQAILVRLYQLDEEKGEGGRERGLL